MALHPDAVDFRPNARDVRAPRDRMHDLARLDVRIQMVAAQLRRTINRTNNYVNTLDAATHDRWGHKVGSRRIQGLRVVREHARALERGLAEVKVVAEALDVSDPGAFVGSRELAGALARASSNGIRMVRTFDETVGLRQQYHLLDRAESLVKSTSSMLHQSYTIYWDLARPNLSSTEAAVAYAPHGVSRLIMSGAVALLPAPNRARYSEEWSAELWDLPVRGRWLFCIRLVSQAAAMRAALAFRPVDDVDRQWPWR